MNYQKLTLGQAENEAENVANLIVAGRYDEAIAALQGLIDDINRRRAELGLPVTESPAPIPEPSQKTGPESP